MKLVLVRHGQSLWNLENRFTGWTDVDLTEKGVEEATNGGIELKEKNIKFDIVYTSYLKRAIKTMNIILEQADQMYLPIKKTWRLNERHYGALQGFNKKETAIEHGEEQVHIWRRSFATPPPKLDKDDKRSPAFEEKYAELNEDEIPLSESLKDTIERVLPYWNDEISKDIKKEKNILIVAHGNSLRALIKYLLKISDEKITELNLPTGKPLIFDIDKEQNVLSSPELF